VQELVVRARSGSLEAFGEIFQVCQSGIYTFICSQVHEPEVAADLTQQTFVRAWESLPRLREVGAFRGWLHRIAANLVRDEVKSGRARLEVRESDLPEMEFAAPERPEQMALQVELKEEVWRALRTLPAEQRTAVVLHHLEGLSVAEIAVAVGVRPGTVMSRLARARDALRLKLARYVEAESYELR
jgi:RNA polymerase sigma-70 factor, ECF subfamily